METPPTNSEEQKNLQNPIDSQKHSLSKRIVKKIFEFLFVGSILMLFGEVWTASSVNPIWFLSRDTYLVFPLSAFVLYLLHFLFYFNLACKTGKTSIPHLYFWGILFGLYEAPITKVLWTITGGEIAFLGIDVVQFMVLVLFWHPIFSFITPILMLQIFSKKGNSITIISSHKDFLQKKIAWSKVWIVIIFITGVFFSFYVSFEYFAYTIITLIGTIAILLISYRIIKFLEKKNQMEPFSIRNLILKPWSFNVITALLLLLYVIDFYLYNRNQIPTNVWSYLSILIFFGFITSIIYFSKKSDDLFTDLLKPIEIKNILLFFALYLITLCTLILFEHPIILLIGEIYYFIVNFIFSPAIFITMLIFVFKKKH